MENSRGRKKKEVNYNSPFAARLRDLLTKTKTTQPMLAEAIGVSRQAIGQWKDGNTLPDIVSLGKIADYFNVSADYLLGRTDVINADPDKRIQIACEYTGLSENSIRELHNDSTQLENDEIIATIPFKVIDADQAYFRFLYLKRTNLGKCIDAFLKKKDSKELIMLIYDYVFMADECNINSKDKELMFIALQYEITDRLKHWREARHKIELDFSDLL